MKRFAFACLLGTLIGLSGCFSPQIDLSGLDGLVRIDKKDGDKDKKEKDKKDKEKKDKND